MYQSTSNSNAFLMGSCRISVPSSSGGYVRLGAARSVKLTEKWDVYEIEADNTPRTIKGAKNQTIEVEGSLLEVNFQKFARMRGGIDTFSTLTFTFDSGGLVTITPQALYLVHTGPTSSQTITATIYYASVIEGLTIPFPKDDGTDVAEIPFKFKGVCQSTRTAGQQLYSIVDTRTSIYLDSVSTDYTSTAA